jgi:hypothetical protein
MTEHALQAHFISSPEKIQNSVVCRQDYFDCFLGLAKSLHDRIFGSWEYCQFSSVIETIKNIRQRVCRVRRSTSPILLLHGNARPHTARAMIGALEMLKFEVLSHLPYSPELVPSDFHFFPHLKRDLKWTHFTSDDEVKQAVTSWIKQRSPEFFIDDICKLVLCWEKCIERQGDYVKK